MTAPKHAPLPWLVEHSATSGFRIVHGEPRPEGYRDAIDLSWGHMAPSPEARANVDFIIRACNSHYDLLESLKRLVSVPRKPTEWAKFLAWKIEIQAAFDQARRTIGKAECWS